MSESLSPSNGTANTPTFVSFRSRLMAMGDPVEGKPETWMVEGEEIGPDTWFGGGADPTDRQARLMKKYVLLKAGDFRCKIPGYDHQLWTDEEISRYLDDIPGMGRSSAHWFPMDIDRIDGNHRHREGRNLRESCHDHNSIYANTAQRRMGAGAAPGEKREIEKSGGGASSSSPTDKRILDLSRGYEAVGRTFVFELLITLGEDKAPDPDRVRVKMRNETGMSRATSYGIMERLVGDEDDPTFPLNARRVGAGLELRFHNSNCYNLKVEQVNAMYPARGYIVNKGTSFE